MSPSRWARPAVVAILIIVSGLAATFSPFFSPAAAGPTGILSDVPSSSRGPSKEAALQQAQSAPAVFPTPRVTEFAVVTNTADQRDSAISGNIVVWKDYRNGDWDIYGKDLSTGAEFAVTTNPYTQTMPAISGNIVVWKDERNGNGDIYGKDLATGREFPITTHTANQWAPANSGNIAVWTDQRNGNWNSDIYGKDLSAGLEFPITTNPARQAYPAISGNIVVWEDYRNDPDGRCDPTTCNTDVYGKNLSTGVEFPVTTNPAAQWAPAISGNIVVWEDTRNGNYDTYGKNLSTGAEFPITTNAARQLNPAISGNLVVWTDNRNYNDDIYGARLEAKWTVMVYLDGDNDLEPAAITDFEEMARVGSDPNVNIVVQFDRAQGYDTRYGDWKTAKRFYVTQEMAPIAQSALADLGEVNMGDPRTLVDFVTWAKASYPAERYALVLWDHGNGWLPGSPRARNAGIAAIACDDTGDCLSLPELRSALQQITNNGAFPLQLLSMDACLMAMAEVDYQLRPYALARTGSEHLTPGAGYPYNTVLAGLRNNPTWNQEQFGSWIVQKFYESYGNNQVQSAVRLGSSYGTLVTAVDSFARALIANLGRYASQIATARRQTQEFYDGRDWPYHAYIDLRHFAERINANISDPTVNAAANAVINAVTGAIVLDRHGGGWPGARGISIYFPSTVNDWWPSYVNPQQGPLFTQQTQWDEFLQAYLPPVVSNLRADPLIATTGTTFRYDVASASTATFQVVIVLNLLGQEMRLLLPGVQPPGGQAVYWDLNNNNGSSVPTGIYIGVAVASNAAGQWGQAVATPVIVWRGVGASPFTEAEARALAEKWLKENQAELRRRLEAMMKAP